VFVDRDGTLIRDVGYLTRLEQIEVLPRVPEAIKSVRAHGLKIAVITNQSAVGRGLLTVEGLELIHREMANLLARAGAFLNGIYYCPHHPTEGQGSYRVSCTCRKPNTGLVERAAGELDLDVRGICPRKGFLARGPMDLARSRSGESALK
jgi:D-glycero-D-manno-heptose 1,7-bisphosphate phosphatase